MGAPSQSNMTPAPSEWLSRYGSTHHDWCYFDEEGRRFYHRPLGLVEGSFDIDGTDFEGRADLHCELNLEVRSSLSPQEFQRRVLLAWAVLRSQHVLLSAKALNGREFLPLVESGNDERHFVVEELRDVAEAIKEARKYLVFAENEGYDLTMDKARFQTHLLNTGRIIEAHKSLARLIVLPEKPISKDVARVSCMFVIAHQISDGLTLFRWMSHVIDLLNQTTAQLEKLAHSLIGHWTTASRLPPAQESLYPPVNGSLARQRWSWLISRILRHTRKPAPASFENPLLRSHPLSKAEIMPEIFTGLLDYSRTPPLNTYSISASLSTPATTNLIKLCRQARISIGAGCFGLVGLVMMLFYERRYPDIPLSERKPFVGSFPLNPRPFLAGKPTTGQEDSLMLAFSDGLTLPFLPSDLPVEGRFKLLGKLADRQLRIYQKRARNAGEVLNLNSQSQSQMIPSLYLGTIERLAARAKTAGKSSLNPQGLYPARMNETGATCGVSSVGDRTKLISSKYDISDQRMDFVADFRDLRSIVKARDGEFLVGSAGDSDFLGFSVSYDGCAIDPELATKWGEVLQNILLPVGETKKKDFGPNL